MTTLSRAEMLRNFQRQMTDYARGEMLRELREQKHLSQEDAAHEIGVTTKTIRTWEKGGPIKWANAKLVGRFYKVNPEHLVTREGVSVSEVAQNAGPPVPYKVADVQRAISMDAKLDAILKHFGIEWLEPPMPRDEPLSEAPEIAQRELKTKPEHRRTPARRVKKSA